jgi:hypothetical protein
VSGADWDAILSSDPQLDLSGVDLHNIIGRLGGMPASEREALIAAIDAEKAKVVKRGDMVDTAFDVFKAVLKHIV